jgi:1,4-alpha-glucan branching enzyme
MEKSVKKKKRRISFKFNAIYAKKVFLVGDFNDWNISSHPMRPMGNGNWQKQVLLATGRYEYKFLVDGTWMLDPENDQTCKNAYGSNNSILSIII